MFWGVLLILLFPVFISFLLPEQPTRGEIVVIIVGLLISLPIGIYVTRYMRANTSEATDRKRGNYIGLFSGIIAIAFLVISSTWLGKRATGIIIASMFAGLSVVLIFILTYYWQNKPRR